MDNNKKLLRPRNGRKISGVCLAVANYFGMDVSIVRILWVLGTIIAFGVGLVLYIACVFIIPEDDGTIDVDYREK